MFKLIKSIVASIKAFMGKVKKYPSHVRWAYIGVFVAIWLFSFEIILSSLQLLLSREIGVSMMGDWLDILIVVAFGCSVVLFVIMIFILGILVVFWGKEHAKDTTQSDIKGLNDKLDTLIRSQTAITRKLGIRKWKTK